MSRHETRFPDFQLWWRERLFIRRTINGRYFSIGKQEWYVAKLRGVYFGDDKPDPYIGVKFQSPTHPVAEIIGVRRALIRDGFRYIHNRDMRDPMMALLLSDENPLPSARYMARVCNMAWEQFVYDFGEGLFEMYSARVGLRHV